MKNLLHHRRFLQKISLPYIIILICVGWGCVGCSGDDSSEQATGTPLADKVIERAHADAEKILATDTATMDREAEIFKAHVTARRLYESGDTAASSLYLRTVRTLVDQAGQ